MKKDDKSLQVLR